MASPSNLVQRAGGQVLRTAERWPCVGNILDVDGQRRVFLVQYRSEASRVDMRQLWDVVDSIDIEALT
jgi:hypothetical protein